MVADLSALYLIRVGDQTFVRQGLPAVKHLPGRHNQQTHGRGGGSSEWAYKDDEVRDVASVGYPATPGWEKGLSDAETQAITRYTGKGGYYNLNQSLRDGTPLSKEDAVTAAAMDKAIALSGKYEKPVTVWRGVLTGREALPPGYELAGRSQQERESMIRKSVADYAERTFKPGSVIRMKGYQSCSFGTTAPMVHSVDKERCGVILEVRTRRGAYVTPFARYDDEAELVLPHNQRYRVRKVIREGKFRQFESGFEHERTIVQLEDLG